MYDVAIIGAGPAGYSAALRASASKAKVVLIEKDRLGGTCLNWGCIPTKYLLQNLRALKPMQKLASLKSDGIKDNLELINKNMVKTINEMRKGLGFLIKSNKIDVVIGEARLLSNNLVEAGGNKIKCRYMLLATGTVPNVPENLNCDEDIIIGSDKALYLDKSPFKVLVLGGGFVGIEMATIFSGLGSEVTVVEKENQIMPGWDKEIARELMKEYLRRGVKIFTSTTVENVDIVDELNAKVALKGEKEGSVIVDKIILCLNRKPDISGLNLEKAGVKTVNGSIPVNTRLQTSVENIYCAGDARYNSKRLAYTAVEEGCIAADNIAGEETDMPEYHHPAVLFSDPEAGTVGMTEDQLNAKGVKYRTGIAMFASNPKAYINGMRRGWIKALSDGEKVFGIHGVGPGMDEIMNTASIIINSKMPLKDIGRGLFIHPCYNETLFEALEKCRE